MGYLEGALVGLVCVSHPRWLGGHGTADGIGQLPDNGSDGGHDRDVGDHGSEQPLRAVPQPLAVGKAAALGTGPVAVNGGTVMFSVKNSSNAVVGASVSGAVNAGSASAAFDPSGLPFGSYHITAEYSGASNFNSSCDCGS